jgi:hypothetical protein
MAGLADVEHGQSIVVGVGDIERFAVRAERQRIWRATERRFGDKAHIDLPGDARLLRVHDAHRIAIAVRHEKALFIRGEQEIIGLFLDLHLANRRAAFEVDDRHVLFAPVADVGRAFIGRYRAGVGLVADAEGRADFHFE